MKKLLLSLSLLLLMATSGFAHTTSVLSSKIDEVTVFLNGAQVWRTAKFQVNKGTSKLVFEDVSPFLDPKSLQARGMDGLLIMDVKHDIRYNEPKAVKPTVIPDRIHREIKQLEDSLVYKGFELEQIGSKISNLNKLKQVLGANKVLSTDSLALLMKAVVFFDQKTDKLDKELFDWKLKQYKQKAIQGRMNARLVELRNFNQNVGQPVQEQKKVHQIVVTVHAERFLNGEISVNYLVSKAGWYPSYDLRSSETNEPLQLTYKASVFQETGENWDDVKLTLSTFNQQCFTSKPSLPVWVLRYHNPVSARSNLRQQINTGYASNMALPTQNNTHVGNNNNNQPQNANIGYNNIEPADETEYKEFQNTMAQVNQSFSNVEFEVKVPYTIAGDGEPVLMMVRTEKVPAQFNHFILPKVNKDAFLMASISNWEDLNLLPGKANIYFDHTFVGQTHINPAIIDDTLELALGRDRGIVTTRKKVKDEKNTRFIGSRKRQTITIEIVVKNTKSIPVTVNLEDQIPVTRSEDIKVELVSSKGAEHEPNEGFLSWDFELKPKESKKFLFTYEVEFDKRKEVL